MAGEPVPAVLDLGSGAGLPGLLFSLMWRHSTVTLLEAKERRVCFLRSAVATLELAERVTVLAGRAEELGRQARWRAGMDLVVARSFGPPALTAEYAAPFLKPGGALVVSEPPPPAIPGPPTCSRWPAAVSRAGLQLEELLRAGDFSFAILRRDASEAAGLPRRLPLQRRRPLF